MNVDVVLCTVYSYIESLLQKELEILIAALCLGNCTILSLTLLRGKFT